MSIAGYKAQNHPQQTGKRGARDEVDDRGTEQAFVDSLGTFDLDVAAAPHNAKAPRYYTREDDGLTLPWNGRIWCNPPYSDLRAWVEKASGDSRAPAASSCSSRRTAPSRAGGKTSSSRTATTAATSPSSSSAVGCGSTAPVPSSAPRVTGPHSAAAFQSGVRREVAPTEAVEAPPRLPACRLWRCGLVPLSLRMWSYGDRRMSPNLPIDSMDRAPSHRKPPVPRASDIAARLAAGETLAVIAAECERTVGTLQALLNQRGFDSAGLSLAPEWDAARVAAHPWNVPAFLVDAICAQTDPEAFFPEKGGSTREAKKVCLSCDVRLECLEWALETDQRWGIWGALSPGQRSNLKKKRAS